MRGEVHVTKSLQVAVVLRAPGMKAPKPLSGQSLGVRLACENFLNALNLVLRAWKRGPL